MSRTTGYRPVAYFTTVFLATWIPWAGAAALSRRPALGGAYVVLLVPGLVAPFVVALWMILRSGSPELIAGLRGRLFDLRRVRPGSLIPMALLMPAVVLVATLLSPLVGQPLGQLRPADGFSFSVGAMPVLLVLLLAAAFEELGWRTYAVESLAERFSYATSTLLFAVLWACWHLPLFLIAGYYQQEITAQSPWFGVNFLVSVVPLAFIISWLCKVNGGSVPVAIGFHFFVNLCQEALQITQVTKCLETGVLLVVAAVVVLARRDLFFDRPRAQDVVTSAHLVKGLS